ncbi:site-specific integrase [Streptomyces reticuliscabiei]|uniref:site-specific integrase n=1 Tax=Streptomyces reticuliscabiei TaxID=146821 RepID=UPI000A3877D6|nr:site-specific integrase [Streptomyces reticuliscabiei]
MKGSTYRRCYCRGGDGKALSKACPQLSSRRHGVWAVRQELPARGDGTRRSFSRSGYETAKDAQEVLDAVRALLAVADGDDTEGQVRVGDLLELVSKDKKAPLPELDDVRRRYATGQSLTAQTTVGAWLDEWLAGRRGRRTGISRDESNIRVHLKPRIGHLRLDRLRVSHLGEMFDAIADDNETIVTENADRREQMARCKWGKVGVPPATERPRLAAEKAKLAEMPPFRHVVGPATRQRIRSTLRAALNDAIAQQRFGITFNPASHVEMDSGRRPKGLLWIDEHVRRWQETGEKPSAVMVWTPEQMGSFLQHAVDDRLYALFHLVTFRGLRRGEACGQRWTDVDLDKGLLTVARQIVQDGWTVYEDVPKTNSGARTIALDSGTVQVLREHRARQQVERGRLGAAWVDTGRIFTREDGSWLRPSHVTDRFAELYGQAELPPVRLHDLRHGAATLIHAGGGDLHAIKETLGHAGIAITSDTYAHMLPQVDRAIAEAAANVVPMPRRGQPAKINGTAAHAALTQPAPDGESEAGSDREAEASPAGQAS